MALMNDFSGVFLVFGLARECKLVFGLAIGDLVDPRGLSEIVGRKGGEGQCRART